jgi:chemotaxis protein MotA
MDPVGFAVVILGTIAVGFMIMPWNLANEIKTTLKAIIKSKNIDMRLFTTDCFKFIESVHAGNPKVESSQDVYGNQILKDGLELLQLGFNTQKTAEILEERILQWNERKNKVSNSIRSLAKYPPAFGLVGTVLGLVSLMRAISEGASSTEAEFRQFFAC